MKERKQIGNSNVRDFLLTQKSINHEMPYDLLEQVITDSIDFVKKENINARIGNIVLNVSGHLVLAQVYVERKNAFAPTKENKFGATPTEYNVQVRFPFGLETSLAGQSLVIPCGNFEKPLKPYKRTNGSITDDVQRDFAPDTLICGSRVKKTIDESNKCIKLIAEDGDESKDSDESLTFYYGIEEGVGYDMVGLEKEFYVIEDHELQNKMNGLYPLFYSQGAVTEEEEKEEEKEGIILRWHAEYQGYTRYQDGICEREDDDSAARKAKYKRFIQEASEEVTEQELGQRWAATLRTNKAASYVFNITQINGKMIYTESGLPVTRLRDYQLELFQNCLVFIDDLEAGESTERAGQISMGVGAGKTFFTFTLLQQLKYRAKETSSERVCPPFCMAPDEGVAKVTKRSIDRQGLSSGMSAITITKKDDLPSDAFLPAYQTLTEKAAEMAQDVDDYLKEGIQAEILDYSQKNALHPLAMINLFFDSYQDKALSSRVNLFKDSIDMKRLLLLVEGQKTLIEKTGMLGIDGLYNILEQFTAIRQGIEDMKGEALFKDAKDVKEAKDAKDAKDAKKAEAQLEEKEDVLVKINYNQTVKLPESMGSGKINPATIEGKELLEVLQKKYKNNPRRVRDAIMRLACLANKDAAVLLANSGGLGNTYTKKEITDQTNAFLDKAVKQLHDLASKEEHTYMEHYTLHIYLNEIFTTIPDQIKFKPDLAIKRHLYHQTLNHHVNLVTHMENKIKEKIAQYETLEDVLSPEELNELEGHGVKKNDNPIRVANQLTGVAGLAITGHAHGDRAQLLLSHVPVFTPEGLASYFEYMQAIEGKPRVDFEEKLGVYMLKEPGGVISREEIQARLEQVLNAIMIADEVHKEAYRFLYDDEDPIYKRIDLVTQNYLGQSFSQVLPPRIGMSGTMNRNAKQAFEGVVLYDLSTQEMVRQRLIKKVSLDSQSVPPEIDDLEKYAMQVVVDYFAKNIEESESPDLFQVSKGLILSKKEDENLNGLIAEYFNLLIKDEKDEDLAPEKKAIQEKLFRLINNKRGEAFPLDSKQLREIGRTAFLNNIFAIYLEYVLSKSTAPKEFSDVVGLQNKLHERGLTLIDGLMEETDLLALIEAVDPKSMTEEDIEKFIQERIKDEEVAELLIQGIFTHKNDPKRFAEFIKDKAENIVLDKLITADRDEFESGKTLAMLGGEKEQTGYSHEPVGIVVDVCSGLAAIRQVNGFVEKLNLQEPSFSEAEVSDFLENLQGLLSSTFSYDEKNQVGGRALRTPSGQVKYIEYQSDLHSIFAEDEKREESSPLAALQVETQFGDIFTADQDRAQKEQASVSFNRYALLLLREEDFEGDFGWTEFYEKVAEYHVDFIKEDQSKQKYEAYLNQRLPLLWVMKYDPENAANYFSAENENPGLFDDMLSKTKASLPNLLNAKKQRMEKIDSSVSELDAIRIKICNTLEAEMKGFLARRQLSSIDDSNDENDRARYQVVMNLNGKVVDIINRIKKNPKHDWKQVCQRELRKAVKNSLSNNSLDKYNELQKMGIRMLNFISFIFVFPLPLKKCMTGTLFYSTKGKLKEAVETTLEVVNKM